MLRRSLVAAGVAAVLVAGTAGTALATSAAAPNRLFGPDRYVTARAVATATFTPGSTTVAILASGDSYADVLPAAYLSGAEQAPLLLTPTGGLPAGLIDTLNQLKVEGVQIVGGTSAVSSAVEQQLADAGFGVSRLAGVDRYDTSEKIAELLPKEAVGTFMAGPAAIVVTGENFVDALAAGPMSASNGFPIVLTNSTSLNPKAKATLTNLAIKQVLIVGGVNAVSAAVAKSITDMGIDVRRIFGDNRYATSVAVANVEKGELKYPMTNVELTRADNFADALVAGARGGHIFAPVLLTAGSGLSTDVRSFISANAATITSVDALGGIYAVSDATLNDAVAAAKGS